MGPRAIGWTRLIALALPLFLIGSPGNGPAAPLGPPAATAPAPGPSAPPTPPLAALASPLGSAAPGSPPAAAPTVRNVLADAPCNASGGNAEVVQAYDPAQSILYETWIGCGGIGFSRSVDGGYSFEPAIAVPPSLTGSSWDPSIALAPNGTVYVGLMLNNGSGDAPAVAWSWDHGQTFAGWAWAFPPASSEFSDRDYLAVAPNGTVYVSWDYSPDPSVDVIGCAAGGSCYFVAGDYNVVVVRSVDGGRTWSAPVPVEPEYPWGAAPAGPLLVEPNGTVDLLYEDYATSGSAHWLGLGRNYFVRSSNGGQNWSTPVPVENGTFPNDTWWIDGQLARDASGTLYATFDTQNSTGDTAFVALSRNDGGSWSAPIRLNPDVDHAYHALASVAADGNGTAYVVWMSNNSTQGWNTYAATLWGNGTTLSQPSVVSAQAGLAGYWVGDTLGVSDLGTGRVAVSWSYGVTVGGVTASQVYAAVLGGTPPVDAPQVTSVVPGVGTVTLGWIPPTGPGDWVGGYLLVWGLDSQRASYNETLPNSATFTTVAGLPPFLRWYFEIAAINGAGVGPFSPPVYVYLTDWGILRGSVGPGNVSVWVDSTPVPVLGGTFLVNTTAGPHVLAAAEPGFFPYFTTSILPWNGTAWVNVSLSEIPGEVVGWVKPQDASVLFDGLSVPTRSGYFDVVNVTPGTHVLTVSRATFLPETVNLSVPRNTTLWANVSLLPANGTLELKVSPVSASVWVGGVSVGLDPVGDANLSLLPGSYAVEVNASGYLPYFANVSVVALTMTPVDIALVPVPVSTPTNSTAPGGMAVPGFVLLALAVFTVVGVAVAWLVVRRRRLRPPDPEGGSSDLWEPDEEDAGLEPEPPAADETP